ncbi:MAG: Sec-independent protein translocase protein TatB [Pyrinomonadaceae bacterium]|nr:Sec-independent protein translocase protein TatB [Pyrinomonadaceae bacterium]MCX7639136.1 Sec-independent protein translocase protein TatB [Pyrinomonadaceae bacterium]MDW8303643.1 Sec-independent protein translocase protein TatB [Acidobacteriota bacterium]
MIILIGESLGWQELLLIGTLALIFLGPKRLPQVAKRIGKTIAEIKRAGQEFRRAWEQEIELEEHEKKFLRNPLDENLIIAEEKYSYLNSDSSNFSGSENRTQGKSDGIAQVNQKQNWL